VTRGFDDGPASPTGGGGPVRLRLDVGYDGTNFSGWASQPGRRTVQGVLEPALCTLLRLHGARLVVAGRTDAGVHATAQVAHLDVARERWQELAGTLVRRLAGVLPTDVRVLAVSEASPDFSARFSALWRRYCYRLTDAESGCPPLRRHDTLSWTRPVDVRAMQAGAQQLLGLHDFVAFCRRRDGASTVRDLQRLEVIRDGALVEVHVQADAFCHCMVRSLVGALLAVGEGRRSPDWPAGLLGSSRRSDEVTVAPAHGLTLIGVGYPADDGLADRARVTRARRWPGELRR